MLASMLSTGLISRVLPTRSECHVKTSMKGSNLRIKIVAGESLQSSTRARVVRRQALGFGMAALVGTFTPKAQADWSGIESIELPDFGLTAPEALRRRSERLINEESAREEDFQESDLLKNLLAKTKENDKTRKRDQENKYCRRGAALNYGDCAGFKFDDDGNIIIPK